MLQEDLSLFVNADEFARPCVFGAFSFNGIFDAPGENMSLGMGQAHSIEYTLRYITTQAALVEGMTGTVAGVSYRVREAPLPQHDGVFSLALLTKV